MLKKSPHFALALVTGASSGIGWALSHLLASNKIPLVVSGRDTERLKALKSELNSLVEVTIIPADLSLTNERRVLIEYIHEHSPDLIINNAGYGLYGDALSYNTSEQLNILTVNANAVLELTLEAARSLISLSKKGIILNVASAAAFETMPGLSVYAAAKSCVVKFSESLDYETADKGVRIFVSCPGMVDTNFRKIASSHIYEDHPKNSMSAQFAAEQIWNQIKRQKPIHIFNWKYRLALFISNYILPKKWVSTFLYKNIRKRIKTNPSK